MHDERTIQGASCRARSRRFTAAGAPAALVWAVLVAGAFAYETPFSAPQSLPDVPTDIGALRAADIDGDGDMDLTAAAAGAGKILWWENRDAAQGGGWIARLVVDNLTGAADVRPVDLDRDGDVDLLAAGRTAEQVVWYENVDGTGMNWTTHVIEGFFAGARSVYPADLDGDGAVDVVAGPGSDGFSTWWRNADGVGESWLATTWDWTAGADAVHAGDVDGDGDVDLLGAVTASNEIAWWENVSGDGSFWTKHSIDAALSGASGVQAVDLDHDGDLDVLATAATAGVVIWYENVDGTGMNWTPHLIADTLSGARPAEAVDVDDDEDLDVVVVASGSSEIVWHENLDGAAGSFSPHAFTAVPAGAAAAAFGDFDRDGRSDAAAAGTTGPALALWWNETTDGPRVLSAVGADVDGDARLTSGETLTLVFTQGVVVDPQAIAASDFHLPTAGDSLGGAGFSVAPHPSNSRQLILTLGAGASLNPVGWFRTGFTAAGSPSGVDVRAGLPATVLKGLSGEPVVDGGEPGVDDWGADVRMTFAEKTTILGALGGEAAVAKSADSVYWKHMLTVSSGTLATSWEVRLAPTSAGGGVMNALKIELTTWSLKTSSETKTAAPNPNAWTLTMQFEAADLDAQLDVDPEDLRIHRLETDAFGEKQWVVLPGLQIIDLGTGTVSAAMSSLDGDGEDDGPTIFACLPGSTIEPVTIDIRPEEHSTVVIGPSYAKDRAVAVLGGAKRQADPAESYSLHRIEIADYAPSDAADPERITMRIRPATLAERFAASGVSFPPESGSLFVVTAHDAAGDPVAFNHPVTLEVQFLENPFGQDDRLTLQGMPGPAAAMRLVRDRLEGPEVDFGFAGIPGQTVDETLGVVRAPLVDSLVGAGGAAAWGAAVDPAVASAPAAGAGDWTLYE